MSDPDFDERLERVRKAAEVIGSLPTESLQADAFHYLIGQPVHRQPVAAPTALKPDAPKDVESGPTTSGAHDADPGDKKPNGGEKKPNARRSRPPLVNPDKTLLLNPDGKESFAEFIAQKRPQSHIEKYVVCVYWILEVAENPKATVAQIVTCYNAAKWKLPTDPRNMASQAGRKELDNTDGLDNIRLSTLGRNMVSELPNREAK